MVSGGPQSFSDLWDAHCHLGFLPGGSAAWDAACEQLKPLQLPRGVFCGTVTPKEYLRLSSCSSCQDVSRPLVRVGLGLHPWWLADGRCGQDEVDLFCDLAAGERFINEVGLDFGQRCQGSKDFQIEALGRMLDACAAADRARVYSFHALRSADILLDMMETRSLTRSNVCILHWFSGSQPQLDRAISLGCYFSVGSQMLSTKRGKNYVRRVPSDHLLLETDLPNQGDQFSPELYVPALAEALALAEEACGKPLREQIAKNSRALLA